MKCLSQSLNSSMERNTYSIIKMHFKIVCIDTERKIRFSRKIVFMQIFAMVIYPVCETYST